MKAEKAREISKEKQIKFELILRRIEACANDGYFQCVIHEYVSNENIAKLMNLGYSTSYGKDQVGVKILIIEWI